MMNEKVSIIVPVYNCRRYLPACLKSLVAQTYHNIEILVIDDGSWDGSAEICDEFAEKYPVIQVLHQKNAGPGVARNVGLKKMSGQYLTYVDGDDYVSKDYVETMVQLMQKYEADIVEVGLIRLLQTRNIIEKADEQTECFEGPHVLIQDYFSENRRIRNCVGGRMYDMRKFRGICFSEKSIGEDSEYSLKMLSKCERLVKYHKCLYVYRAYQQSLTRNKLNHKHFDVVDIALRDISFIKKLGIQLNNWDYVYRNFIDICYRLLGEIASEKCENEFKDELDNMLVTYHQVALLAQKDGIHLSEELTNDILNIQLWAEKYRRKYRKQILVKHIRNSISGLASAVKVKILYEYKF